MYFSSISGFALVLAFSAMAAVYLYWWIHGDKPIVEENGWLVVKRDAWFRGTSIVVTVACAIVAVDVYKNQPGDAGWAGFFFAVTLFMVVYGLPDFFRYEIRFNADEFIVRTAWAKERRISWTALTKVEYAPFRQAYRVHTESDGIFFVYDGLGGSEEFMSRVRAVRETKQRRVRAN
jgi:hypothetical protein